MSIKVNYIQSADESFYNSPAYICISLTIGAIVMGGIIYSQVEYCQKNDQNKHSEHRPTTKIPHDFVTQTQETPVVGESDDYSEIN